MIQFLAADVLNIVLPFVGGLIGAGLTALVAFRNSKRSDFESLIDTFKEDNNRLREANIKLEVKMQQLEEKQDHLEEKLRQEKMRHDTLQHQLTLLEVAHIDLPLPQWMKDTKGIMLTLNDAYETHFLMPNNLERKDYVGHTDIDVWGEEIGKEYQRNDAKVKQKKRAMVVRESIHIKRGDITDSWIIMKYPIYSGRVLIGIAGVAFPVDNTSL